jgi:bifunctional DNase/RNase
MTHELFGHVLDALGVHIERAVVNALDGSTFLGRLILKQDGRTFDVDSRPSDAIALAVQKQAPIFVAEEVLASTRQDA